MHACGKSSILIAFYPSAHAFRLPLLSIEPRPSARPQPWLHQTLRRPLRFNSNQTLWPRAQSANSWVLQSIIRHAITQATDDVLLRKNWPEENNRSTYGKERLLKACRDKIIRTYDVIAEVKTRIKKDPDFMKGLSDLVSLVILCGSGTCVTV